MLKWGDSIPSSHLPIIPGISEAHLKSAPVPTALQVANVKLDIYPGHLPGDLFMCQLCKCDHSSILHR